MPDVTLLGYTHNIMIGVDEVGRGAWAGPLLVVAARLKPHHELPDGLTDSKLLTKKQKDLFFEQLLITCDFGEGWVEVSEIDEIGLSAALKLGALRSLSSLGDDLQDSEICIDGSVNFLEKFYPNSYPKIKADISVPIVSAASVYAKVVRDRYMTKLHFENPEYGFNTHVGYGTQGHVAALKKYGVSKYHRKSFKPIMELL
jgi:ribonuclease HII